MVEPDCCFHSHTRSTNFSRPRSWRVLPSRLQLALDHDLRGDAGVVGADHPVGVEAAHAVIADQRIHQRLLERVAHVQRAGDVRRRQLDAIGGLRRRRRQRRNSRAIPRAGYQRRFDGVRARSSWRVPCVRRRNVRGAREL